MIRRLISIGLYIRKCVSRKLESKDSHDQGFLGIRYLPEAVKAYRKS